MTTAVASAPGLGPAIALERWIARAALVGGTLFLVFTLAWPLAMILAKSVEDRSGAFVGIANFAEYLTNPGLLSAIERTLTFAALTTLLTVPLAFGFAYAIQRSCMPGKSLLRGIALVPILTPSMLSALSFIYLFGNQGLLKSWLGFFGLKTIYGLPGMVFSMVFSAFPHALMILLASLALADARLFEAADSLGTTRLRKFLTVTLPGMKYGLISATMVVFTMATSEFGVPKVIGGNYQVLAIDVYTQVVGQQNFPRGAVVSLLLLLPALAAFGIDWWVQRRQRATLSVRSVPYRPAPSRAFDLAMFAYCLAVVAVMLAVIGMATYASFVKFWPYDFSLSLKHYAEGLSGNGMDIAYWNSVKLATGTAVFGTLIVFGLAYLVEKTRELEWLKPLVRMLASLPMAVPGLVLGLAYIFFFNHPANPVNALYETMTLLVLCTIVHFYSSAHLTAVTALKGLDGEFEAVSASLKVPFYRTFVRVTVPVCLPSILEIARYLFVNAMTTISALVFIYSPSTKLASIAIVHLDEAGDIGAAAAMATLIVATSAAICIVFWVLQRWLERRTQAWRK